MTVRSALNVQSVTTTICATPWFTPNRSLAVRKTYAFHSAPQSNSGEKYLAGWCEIVCVVNSVCIADAHRLQTFQNTAREAAPIYRRLIFGKTRGELVSHVEDTSCGPRITPQAAASQTSEGMFVPATQPIPADKVASQSAYARAGFAHIETVW